MLEVIGGKRVSKLEKIFFFSIHWDSTQRLNIQLLMEFGFLNLTFVNSLSFNKTMMVIEHGISND